jgi:alkylation response protein AidB-like acyl-CoA dehydrogenase
LALAGAPVNVNTNRVGYTGPTLIAHGTEAQKAEHLPAIASGESMWIQGFSEPGAGSDLAALATRAVHDGDDYLVSGQKIWTSFAHHGDWMILLARTDPKAPKHRGITYLLVDMRSPGITVRPLQNLHNEVPFGEVYFDNVRVPASNRVGEENRGWYIATTTLDYERSSVANSAACRRLVARLPPVLQTAVAREPDDLVGRHAVADLAISAEIGRWLCFRVVSLQAHGEVPNMEASVAKLFNSELLQRIGVVGMRLAGLSGQCVQGKHALDSGAMVRHYQSSVARTIGGGTSEIQRSIIAQRGLSLPR